MTFKPAQWPRRLRSAEWYEGNTKDVIYHRGWMKNQGYPDDLFDGRPVIGILNTWSDMTPCNGHRSSGGLSARLTTLRLTHPTSLAKKSNALWDIAYTFSGCATACCPV